MKSKINSVVTRRNFFRLGAGTIGTIAASHSLAQMCGVKTGAQDLGPFFPRPGSPETVVAENPDPTVPVFLANDNDLTFVKGRTGKATGQVVNIKGQLTDEACKPLANATIIVWQASYAGRYNHKGDAANPDFIHPKTGETVKRLHDPEFQYWGQAQTDQNGEYSFKTIIPGFYPADLATAWYRPPHIHFLVSSTGLPQFVTQMYFKGDKVADNAWIQELNQRDLILQTPRLTDSERQKLIVEFKEDLLSTELNGEFNIVMPK